jgi:O-antigen ligase
MAVIFGSVTSLVLVALCARSALGIQALRLGWVVAYIATAVVAIWEVQSGAHLSGYWTSETPAYAQAGLVISTFGNPNNYSGFLVLSLPFLLWSYSQARGLRRLWYLGLVGTVPLFLLTARGRLSLVAFALQIGLMLVWSARGWRATLLPVLIAVAVAAGVLASGPIETTVVGKVMTVQEELATGGSASIRWNLLRNGLAFTEESFGFGMGAGSFQSLIASGHAPYPTGKIVDPHNFWIEILSQYGAVVFLLFVFWLIRLAMVARAARRATGAQDPLGHRRISEVVLLGLLGYLFAAVENSSFLLQPTNWLFLGSILVLATVLSRPGMEGDRLETSRV